MTETEFKCTRCGSLLHFAPGTDSLKCLSCGTENRISEGAVQAVEEDFDQAVSHLESDQVAQATEETTVQACGGCGASTTRSVNVTATRCPYCGTSLVDRPEEKKQVLQPKYLLPFRIEADRAQLEVRNWVKRLWFAPSDLLLAFRPDRLQGVYVPIWTFDCQTFNQYRGERGTYYETSETYVSNGKTETRRVRKVRWMPVSGSFSHAFDDLVVMATKSLPEREAYALQPWDFKEVRAFDRAYLSGFRSELHQIGLREGFTIACQLMKEKLMQLAARHIGGDLQRVHSLQTRYSGITFKHLLVPVWISAFRYKGKVYRVLVNARTGEVQAQRPWSWVKIAFAALSAVLTVWLALVLYEWAKYGEFHWGRAGLMDVVLRLMEAAMNS